MTNKSRKEGNEKGRKEERKKERKEAENVNSILHK